MGRVLITTTTAAFVFLAAVASGSGKGYPLVFDRISVEPGDLVVVSVPGTPSNVVPDPELAEPGVRVYLVAVADARDVRRFLPVDSRLIEIGKLQGLLGYQGRVEFRVPKIPPGPYTTAVRVRGAFSITYPSAKREYGVRGPLVLNIRRSSSERSDMWLAVALAVAAAVAVAAIRTGALPAR